MPVDDVAKVITTLFTAPTEAAVNTAVEQRRIWIKWLEDVNRILETVPDDAERRKAIIREHLRLAPTWKLAAQVSVGITMRVASINRFEGGVTLGLGLSMLQVAGSFGFVSESTSESVLHARAQYALTNDAEVTLGDYLDALGVGLAEASDVTSAIERLESASTPIPAPNDNP